MHHMAASTTKQVTTVFEACGSHVSRHFVRVFGDNRNLVYACPECLTANEFGRRP